MSGPPPLEDMSGNLVNAKKTREAKQVEHDRHMAYVKMMKAANEQPPEGPRCNPRSSRLIWLQGPRQGRTC